MRAYITEFGAVPDGETLCTAAISEAIDKVSAAGGGYVIVPPGTFLTGGFILKSNVYLWLEPGSLLLASMRAEDFSIVSETGRRYNTMILAEYAENCGVIGEGTINLRRNKLGYTKEHGRPNTIYLKKCKNVNIRGVSLLGTGGFCIFSIYCVDIKFDSLTINSEDCENGDGIDFCGSKNVTISNCNIRTGDDAIGLKTSDPEEPCENFSITNCVLSSSWAGIRLGPETCGDMKNITVSNCVFNDCSDGMKVQLCDSYLMQDLTFSNLNMVNVKRPLFFTLNSHSMSGRSDGTRPTPGIFRRVLISNVMAHIIETPHDWFENQVVICGIPDAVISDVMIENMHVLNVGGGKADDGRSVELPEFIQYGPRYPDVLYGYPPYPSSCMYIKNAARIRMVNCVFETIAPDERHAVAAENVDGLLMCQNESRNTAGLLRHYRVNDLSVVNCNGSCDTLSPELAKRWDAFREFSLREEQTIIDYAKVIDKVKKMDTIASYTHEYDKAVYEDGPSEITFDFETEEKEVYLYIRQITGSVKITENGETVFEWIRPVPYNDETPLACDISPYVKSGKNTIKVETTDGTIRKPVFSVFSPSKK